MTQKNRDLIEDLVHCINSQNIDSLLDLVHDDYVEIYPQSGERIRGKENLRQVYENFPNLPKVKGYRVAAEGTTGYLEMLLDYPDSGVVTACEIIEFRDGKIASIKAYFAQPFEAPDWRSEWVEMIGEPATADNYDSRPSAGA